MTITVVVNRGQNRDSVTGALGKKEKNHAPVEADSFL